MTQACVDGLKESSIRVVGTDRNRKAKEKGSRITATTVEIKIETGIGIIDEIIVGAINAIKVIIVAKAGGVKETTKKTQSTKAGENAL